MFEQAYGNCCPVLGFHRVRGSSSCTGILGGEVLCIWTEDAAEVEGQESHRDDTTGSSTITPLITPLATAATQLILSVAGYLLSFVCASHKLPGLQ